MTILDTNAISEAIKPSPHPSVAAWFEVQEPGTLYTSSISEAEVLFGILAMPPGRRRDVLLTEVEDIFTVDFADRILPFDNAAARAFAVIASDRKRTGRPLPGFDGLIAAIALSHGASVATRNVKDFEGCGLTVINPWEFAP